MSPFKHLLFAVACILASLGLGAQTANFTADITAGCSPLVVHFTNTSTGATSYSWDLGNTVTTTLTDASGSYLTAGTYTVKLTATNGASSNVKTMTITVYANPSVAFTANNTKVCNSTAIQFTNTSSSSTGGTLTYNWNFGDGGSDNSTNPTHTYALPGFYSVTLDVVNGNGCDSTLTKNAYIHVLTPPVPNFSLNSTYFCQSPASAIFTDLTTGSGGYTYAWNFGDGSPTSVASNPTHSYSGLGKYFTVTLGVTDANGCIGTVTKDSVIHVAPLSPGFTNTYNGKGCSFQRDTFTNTTPNAINLNVHWDFGDGYTSTETSPIHVFNATGNFNVKMTVSNGNCSDSVTKTIVVGAPPVATITYTPANPCPAPVTVQYTASATGSPGITYQWLFADDGSISSFKTTPHTFYNNGNILVDGYPDSVLLIVTDTFGCRAAVTSYINIYDAHLTVTTDKSAGCAPLTVNTKLSLYTDPLPNFYPSPIVSYTYDFGDGSLPTHDSTATHIYVDTGHFKQAITVITASGCVITDTEIIKAGILPAGETFYTNATHFCGPTSHPVTFHGSYTSNPNVQYIYDDGNGGQYVSSNPVDTVVVRQYSRPGNYNTYLYVNINGCTDTVGPVVISIDSPSAGFLPYAICDTSGKKSGFINLSIGATSFLWLFSDGTQDTVTGPIHKFPSLGIQSATLIAHNSRNGCSDTVTEPVSLIHLIPMYVASDTIICANDSIYFNPVTSGGNPMEYRWDIDTAKIEPDLYYPPQSKHGYPNDHLGGPFPKMSYFFTTPGIHVITLYVQDSNWCIDTYKHNILVAQPVAQFTASPTIGCRPLQVLFTDHILGIPGTTITNRQWRFGDNSTLTTTSPVISHTYISAGSFDVTLIAQNSAGCTDSLTLPAYITALKPTAVFTASNLTPCIGAGIQFSNTSTGNGTLKFRWSFGDGGTDTNASPAHLYTSAGAYNVRLIVTDSMGCIDTLLKTAYINVLKPHAAFSTNDSTAVCPPLKTCFINTTTGAATYYWDLGNTNTSPAFNPCNTYTAPGTYTVTLVATNSQGCSDTVVHHVQVYGYAGAFTYTPLLGCSPMTVNFTANVTNVPNIQFDFNDGVISPGSAATIISHQYTTAKKYLPRIILSNGGCNTFSIGLDTIRVDSLVEHYKLLKNAVCVNDTAQFTDSSYALFSAISSWLWTFDNGQTGNTKNVSHVFKTTGVVPITLSVTSASGCHASMTDSLLVNPLPIINALGDTIVCVGDAALLSATGGVAYSWKPITSLDCNFCPAPKATPNTATVYDVTGTDSNGCTNTDSVKVQLKTKTLSSAGQGGAMCYGDTLQLLDTGGQKYSWYPPEDLNDPNIPNPVTHVGGSTNYRVIVQLADCEPDTNFVFVLVYPKPTVKAIGTGLIVAGNTAQLQATGTNVVRFRWSPAGSINCDSCSDPVSRADSTTIYTVTAFSAQGCEDSDKVTVRVLCDQSQVFIPNTFTPNGDGQNDIFFPRGVGLARINSFRVYNRWGQIVFQKDGIELNDEKGGWDGTFNGAAPKPDVYIYYIDAVCQTGEAIHWNGDVTLVR